ncbi:MAG: hypothetical protein KGJ60_13255 [Verrucomicrobiota bacterium]|nr:hypothetical protein [Verrucomicrobiota bacterium]
MNETQDFESLKRLLALKRHEAPPPGFFDRFSGDVLARLRAGETEAPAGWRERLFGEESWAARLLGALQTQQALAGGFAMALCALLVAAVIYAQRPESAPASPFQPVQANALLSPASPAPFVHASNPLLASNNSTNPVMSAQPPGSPSLFDQINAATFQVPPEDASYSPAGSQ